MKQRCEQCGEELFGAVNRCWKCGASVAKTVQTKIPPVRRSPVDLTPSTSIESSAGVQQISAPSVGWSDRALHRFAATSVTLGGIGCIVGIASGWALLVGGFGLGLGLVGMHGRKRDLATMGLALSVLSIFVGLWQVGSGIWGR